ncbi:MAG: hypothetical protein BWK76_07040 [Desulfobulbaceae bacterium A2]|nr:MAG: hypothetical protein BWK76_07040 [Desulfobulbaceae bacterium A2]
MSGQANNSGRPRAPRSPRNPQDLRTIPGVGPSLAKDLVDLGFCRVSQLQGADPEQMYRRLCALRGGHIDRCVLYVFRCAVYYAGSDEPDPALLRWWAWKDRLGPGRACTEVSR